MKLLVIRFSAIGDLILTAPVLEALRLSGAEVHLLCKERYQSIAELLPGPTRIWNYERIKTHLLRDEFISSQGITAVLDLQGTAQSKRWTKGLKVPVRTYAKPYVKRFLLTALKHKSLALDPIVARYTRAAGDWLSAEVKRVPLKLQAPDQSRAPYLCLVLGGTHAGKRLSTQQWQTYLNALQWQGPITVLGTLDELEENAALDLDQRTTLTSGSLEQAIACVAGAACVVVGDTGLMHAAAAMNVPMVVYWGSTHPYLGFEPYAPHNKTRYAITASRLSPAHKHGKVPAWMPNPARKINMAEMAAFTEQILQDRTTP